MQALLLMFQPLALLPQQHLPRVPAVLTAVAAGKEWMHCHL
jgi:hypothetical protein